YGGDFNEARIRMKNALSEFTIEGINTTIPIHKTIIEESNFMNGNISTDYIEKYNIIEKIKDKRNQEYKDKAYPAICGILLQSEFVKKSNLGQSIKKGQKSMDGGFF
ncbi:MAG: acetyl-CoA carboxylase biotin carboxylase subunit, partial [Nitrososphaeraceae archaeon]